MSLVKRSNTATYIEHKQLGWLEIHFRRDSRCVRARWSHGFVKVTAPASMSAGDVMRAVDEMAPRIAKFTHRPTYHAGQLLEFDGWHVEIKSQSHQPERIIYSYNFPASVIALGSSVDFDSDTATQYISGALKNIAAKFAPSLLIPKAQTIAEQLGCRPASWKIKNTTRQLGSCNRRGEISLSSHLMFLSDELRHYVICHELAHLSEMNHSQRFHSLLNVYLNGRERVLEAKLRTFPWPILR